MNEIQKKVTQSQELKKQGMQNASESQIEVDQQYALPEEIDIDIFSKKRAVKANDDDVVDDNQRASDVSNRHMLAGEDAESRNNAFDSTKKRLVRPKQDTKEIAAKLRTVKHVKN